MTHVGRGPDNEIVVEGDEGAIVSARRLKILREGMEYHLQDLGSTNRTYVNGARVREVALTPGATIELGPDGPVFTFLLEESPAAGLDQTMLAAPSGPFPPLEEPMSGEDEQLLAAARARRAGARDQTLSLMHDAL